MVQHGVVLSEVRTEPGPTDSVFDVLAALVAVLKPDGRLGLLGFAGGAVVAPLRCLGVESAIETCDLDRRGYSLFEEHCSRCVGPVQWEEADAVSWLQDVSGAFDLLIDDLSIPLDDDVFKPECSWTTLPPLMKKRIRSNGIVVSNQLKPVNDSWKNGLKIFQELFANVQVVHLDDFENRIVIAGVSLPTIRETSGRLRRELNRLKSKQAGKISVRRWVED